MTENNRKFGLKKVVAALLSASLLSIPGISVSHASSSIYGATTSVVKIGYLTNLTHAPALIAKNLKYFEKNATQHGTEVQYASFNAGPDAINALKGGAIDIAFVGPNPTISGYVSTAGTLLKVIAGSTSGGASLVVKPNINSAQDLKGKKIDTPQLGNTQDVALRIWLKSQGLKSTLTGGGDVSVIPTSNSTTLNLFKSGQISGAWVPEPWATQLVAAGGKVLVNEASLWPKGNFVTTNVVASTEFLNKYPGTVADVLSGELEALDLINSNPDQASATVNTELALATGKPLDAAILKAAWNNITFTIDPIAKSVRADALNAERVGLLAPGAVSQLRALYDLRIVNKLLKARKQNPVAGFVGSDK